MITLEPPRADDEWSTLLTGWVRTSTSGGVDAWTPPDADAPVLVTKGATVTILRAWGDFVAGESLHRYSFTGRLSPTAYADLSDEATPDALTEWDAERRAARDLDREVSRLRTTAEARRILAEEHAEALALPDVVSLDEFLEQDDPDADYRIDRLLPTGGNVLFPAPAKAGKSTTIGNLCRTLVDGEAFLGEFSTEPARVVLIDNEMDPRNLRRWLRDQQIHNTQQVQVVSLRGRTGSFNILDDATRAKWADQLRGADVLIFDCLRPALDALGLDENRDAGQFLVALDALKQEAGISEGILVHHMGHTGERARGDSRLLGWPDVTWKITLEKPDDPTSPRYFSAFGRDVDVHDSRLDYDPTTRRLSISGQSRRMAAIDLACQAVIDVLTAGSPDGMTQNEIEDALKTSGIPRKDVRTAIYELQKRQITICVPGRYNAKKHILLPTLASSPTFADSSPANTPASSPPPI